MSVNRTCTSRHIPTFHGGQSCPNPVAEAHPVNEKTPKADAALVVRGIGIITVRIPINQVAAQNDRSRFSTMRHPWFLSHAKMTTHRIPMFIFSILVCVSSAAERYKCYKDQALSKSKFSGEKSNIIRRLWHECFYSQQLFKRILKESKQPIGP